MQKFLRTLTLLALIAVPWVAQGQNANVSEYDMSYSTATYTSVTTSGGNALTFTNGSADVTMPFAMYFGTTQIPSGSTLTVKQNGSVSFATLDGSYIAPMRYASGYTGGTVYAKSTASQLTIEWRKVTSSRNIYSFQLCLYPSGNIEFRYGPMTLDGSISVLVGMKATATDYFRLRGEGGTLYWNSMERVLQNETTRTLSSAYHPDYDLATGTGVVYTFTKPACVKPTMGSVTATTAWDTLSVSWSNSSTPDSYQIAYSTSGIDFNTADASQYTVVSTTIAASATSAKVKVPTANTTYYVAVRAKCGTNYSAWSATDYATTPTGCPTSLSSSASGVTATGATLNWTNSLPATSYDIRYNLGDDFDPAENEGTLVTSNTTSKTLSGLTGASTYYYYIRVHCASGLLTDWFGPYTFGTACGAQNVPYTNTLAEGSMPSCWSEEVIAGSDHWQFYNNASFTFTPDASARLITPIFNLSTTGNYQVEFNHAEPDYQGVCDSLWLYYRTSATASWVRLAQYGNHSSNLVQETVLLPNPTATYQLAFVGYGMDGNSIYVANFRVRTVPTCLNPSALAISEHTGSSVTLSWTNNGPATAWQVAYGHFEDDEDYTIANATTNPFTVSNLGLGEWFFYVRSNCGSEQSDWVGPVSQNFGYCTPTVGTTDGSGLTHVVYGESMIVDHSMSGDEGKFYHDYSSMIGDGFRGNSLTVNLTYTTSSFPYGVCVWVDWNQDLDFEDDGEEVYLGAASFNHTVNIAIPATVALGDYRMRIGGHDGSAPTTMCGNFSWSSFQDYTIRVVAAPSCFVPAVLTVSNITTTSATLTWNEVGLSTQWEVKYGPTGFDPSEEGTSMMVSTTPTLALDYLQMGTTYDAYVRAICDPEGPTNWSTGITFSTPNIACLQYGDPGAEQTVTIGEGTSTNTYLPSYSLYNYSLTEQIYTADEIGGAGIINSIALNFGNIKNRTVNIYLVETDKSSFANVTDWVPVTDANLVYSGALCGDAAGWKTYALTTPFTYSGTGNLLLVVDDNTGTWQSGLNAYVSDATGMALRVYSDGTNYDPTNPSSYSGTKMNVRNNIQLGIQYAQCVLTPCYAPQVDIALSETEYAATLTFTSSNPDVENPTYGMIWGPQGFNLATAGTTVSPITNGTATISNLTARTTYDVYVYAVCGSSNGDTVRYSFTTPFIPNCKTPVIDGEYGASNITYNTATLTWRQPGDAPQFWTVRYADADFDPATAAATDYTEMTVTSASANLTGLVAGTTYYVYIKATCATAPDLDESPWLQMSNANPAYTFTTLACNVPAGFVAQNVTNSTAWLKWDNTTGINGWTVRYSTDNTFNTYTDVNVTVDSVKLTGLDADAIYYAMVKANCTATDQSDWSDVINFRTSCPDRDDSDVIGTAELSSNGYFPIDDYYKYTYTQQIFTAEEMGGAKAIGGVRFHYAYSTPMSSAKKTNVTIYVAHTDKSSFASTTDWVAASELTEVYTGALICSQGWNEFLFDTPFAYNGTDNLVIAIDDNSNAYDGNAYKFYTTSTTDNMALAYRNDSQNPDPLNPPTGVIANYRSDIQFVGTCNTDVTCFAPVIDSVKLDSSNHVTLYYKARTDLEPVVNVFDINYGIKGFDPDRATQFLVSGRTANTYQFTAQLSSTEYDVYVRTHCGENDHSKWTKASFESYPAVFAPSNLTATGNTETSVTLTWKDNNPVAASQWELVAMEPGILPDENGLNAVVPMISALSKTATISGLQHMKFYDFYVRAVKGSDKSDWSAVCTASTGCGTLQIADMPFTEDFENYTGNTSGTLANHVMPNCWDYVNGGSNSSYAGLPSIYKSTTYSYSGQNTLRFYEGTAATYNRQFAVLPQVGFALDTLELSFYARFNSSSNMILVGVMNSQTDTASFQVIDTVKAPSTGYNTQKEYSVSFKNYTGTKRYIAFMAPKLASNYIYVDDVTLKLREKVNNVGSATADLAICNEYVQPVSVSGSYPANLHQTYVIRPAEAGKVVNLSGDYDLESGYDFIYLYEGEGANKVIVDTLTGNGHIDIHTTSNDWVNRGAYTLVFHTDADNSLPMIGFKFLAQCICPEVAPDVVATRHEANGTYTWNGMTRTNQMTMEAAPDYEEVLATTLTNVAACDSVALEDTLILHPTYNLPFSRTICQRDTAYFFDTAFTTQGVYTVTLQTVHGGDSTGVLSLTVNNAPTAGIYFDGNLETAVAGFCDGADMLLEARSNVNNATFLWEDSSVAALRTVNPHLSNSYSVIAINPATGCTSVPVTISVTTTPVAAPAISATDSTICRGQSTTLTVTENSNLAGITYKWSNNQTGNSITVTPDSTATYSVTATTATGCATTANFTVTVIQLPEVTLATSVSEVCRDSAVTLTATPADGYSFVWSNGANTAVTTVNPNVTGDYTVTVTDAYGCSQEFTTAAITVHPSYEMNVEASECVNSLPYTFGTQSLTEDGLYTELFTIAHDCDSLVHLTFSVQDTAVNNSARELCYGTVFTFGEGIYQQTYTATESTVITYLDTTSGCPAYYNLNLTVNMPAASSFSADVCDAYTWKNGQTVVGNFTETGIFVDTMATTKGCDSVVTLNLTVRYSTTGIDNQDVCDQLEWIDGNVYTEPDTTGLTTFTLTNAANCDSVVTLNLTAVRHATTGIDDITYCDDTVYTWINGRTYKLSETRGNIRYTLTDQTNVQGCDSTVVLNLVMNPVRDTVLWRDTTVCDELLIRIVTCEGAMEDYSISDSGDYQLRVHNAELDRDEILQLHVHMGKSTTKTTIAEGCLPYEWDVTGEGDYFTVAAEDHVGENLVVVSKEVASVDGCSVFGVLRLTAHHPVIENVEPVLCFNDEFDTLGHYYVAASMVENENYDYNITLAKTPEGCDSTLHLHFTVLDSTVITVFDTLVEGQFEWNAAKNRFEYAWVSQTNIEDTLILTLPNRYTQEPYDGSMTTTWAKENGCDSTITVEYHVLPMLYSYEPDTVVCSEFTWKRDGRIVTTVTKDDAEYIIGNLNGIKFYAQIYDTLESMTYGYDSLVVKDVYFWGNDTVTALDTNVCTEYTWQGQTYWADSTFYVLAGQTVNGCDSINAYTFRVIGSAMYDWVVVTNEPYYWWPTDSTYKQSTNEFVDVVNSGCDIVYHLNISILDHPVNYCADDDDSTVIYLTGDTIVPSELMPGHYYSEKYAYVGNTITHDTLIGFYVRPISNQLLDTVVCAANFTWNDTVIADTGVYTQHLVSMYGCDSVVTYNAWISGVDHTAGVKDSVVAACDAYTFSYYVDYTPTPNDSMEAAHTLVSSFSKTFEESIDTTMTFKTAAGCDTIVNLSLTINKNTPEVLKDTACEHYVWLVHNNAASAEALEVTLTDGGNYHFHFTATDANGCQAIDSLYLHVKENTYSDWDTVVNEPSFVYRGQFFQAPYDDDFTFLLGTAANGCDSILTAHIVVTTGEVVTVTKNECGRFTWSEAENGNGHTYQWIDDAEKAANGNALYKDITDNVYIHNGENPKQKVYAISGTDTILTHTYVLWLNLYEALFADTTIARYPVTMGNTLHFFAGNDSLNAVNLVIPADTMPTAAKPATVHIDTTLSLTYKNGYNNYYGCAYYDVHLNVVYNFDTAAAIVNCYEKDSAVVSYGTIDTIINNLAVADSAEYDIVYNEGTFAEQNIHYFVTRKAEKTGMVDDTVVCNAFTWPFGDNDSVYTVSTSDLTTTLTSVVDGCDSVVTMGTLIVNTPTANSYAITGCDSVEWNWNGLRGDTMYYVSTVDTLHRYEVVNQKSCLAVDTVKVTVVPTVKQVVLDTAVCDSYTWRGTAYTTSGKYVDEIEIDTNNTFCYSYDTLKLVVNYSVATTPEDTIFGQNYREAGQLYTAPYEGTVVRNLQTVAGCDSVATVHLVLAFYNDTNIVRSECGVYTWSATDFGNGHYYRSISDEEYDAHEGALYYDETDGVYVISNPTYAPAKGEPHYGYRYHLQLSLQGAVFSEKDSTYLLSKGAVMTYAGVDYDYSSVIARKASMDTIQTVRFGAVAGACDSIQNFTVHVVYNYTHEKDTVCAEHANTYTWRGKNWTLGAQGTVVTFADTAAKNTANEWIYTNEVFRTVAIATTDEPIDTCDKFVWGNTTFTKDTTNVSVKFTALNGCDSTVTRASITIRHSSQFDSTVAVCDQFKWNERSDSIYTASTVDTVIIKNAVLCDSLQILHLTINRNPGSYTDTTVCDQFYWAQRDTIITESGMFKLLSVDSNTCQNYDTLTVVVNKSTVTYDTVYNGEGAVRYNGHLYVAPNGYSYADTSWINKSTGEYDSNGVGCYNIDSIYVKIGNFYHRDVQVVACQTYTWPMNEHTYTFIPVAQRTAGAMYYDATAQDTVFINPTVNIANEGSYDSVIMLMLTLTQNVTNEDSVVLPVSLAYVHYGDSTFSYTEQRDQALNGGIFDGYEDIRYVHFFSVQYCDSVIALHVSVYNNYVPVDTVDICATDASYTWRGHTISTATTDFDNVHNWYIYDTVETAEGPVVEYLRIVQHPVVYTVERRYACDQYVWNGDTLYESTTNYTKVFEGGGEAGNMCDSTVILHLTLYNTTSTLTVDTVCDTYTWNFGNNQTRTYTQSIDTIAAYDNVYQYKTCHSADTLRLVVNHKQTATETAVACDSYEQYTFDVATGEYIVDTTFFKDTANCVRVLTDMNGCDSTVTLTLTVNHSTQRADTIKVTAFQEYIAPSGKVVRLFESTLDTVFTDTIQNLAGCDSIQVIKLVIKNGEMTNYAFICDSVVWHNDTYTEAGTYYYQKENSIVKDTLVIGEVHHASHNVYTEVACNSLTWEYPTYYEINAGTDSAAWVVYDTLEKTYTTSGTKKDIVYINAEGCESRDTLKLTINHRTFAEDVETACGSFDWIVNDSLIATFTQSIETQTAFFNPATKCDSVVFLKLTVLYAPVIDTFDTICQSALPYTWRGIEMTEAGVEEVTFPMENTCDSTIRFTLTVNPVYETNLTASVCLGNGYNENGFDIAADALAEPGVYFDTLHLTSIAGCDSTVTLTLTVGDVLTSTEEVAACDFYVWNGTTYTQSGVYTRSYDNPQGCASIDTLILTINVNHGVVESQTVCSSFTWNGNVYTETGTYYVRYADENGCWADSVLHLTIADTEQVVYTATACESYEWLDGDSATYTESGVYTYEYINEAGCPGVATLNLTINNAQPTVETVEACDTYTWNGTIYDSTGVYTAETLDSNGCIAVDTLVLTINNSYVVDTFATACGSFEWYGVTYTTSAIDSKVFEAGNGCDSLVVLNLVVNQPTTSEDSAVACVSFVWNGDTLTESGVYTDTLVNLAGCDSIVTLTLTINEPINAIATASACDSYTWFDEPYTTSGTYNHAITDINGCAATATLGLTIYNSVNDTISAENCVSYTWNDQTYYGSGSYTQSFQTIHGCDSTVTLNLTINVPTTGSEIIESCNAITWHGQNISTSGAYIDTIVNAAGCDSIVTLFFTRLQAMSVTVNQTACSSYEWNGTTYTTSGTYTYDTIGDNGCDSLTTLVLTINEPINTSTTASACESYTWFDEPYTTSGTYTHAITDVNGCAATATLNLTINNDVYNTVSAEACGSYIWNGDTYTASGSYLYIGTTIAGCDSIVTLDLTINEPVTVTLIESACTSYEWNGETYTTSGTYADTTTGINGCDSITVLVLTVNQPVYTNLSVTADGSYNWNGTVYTESGVYTYTTEGSNGCDSVVTLDLTVNPIYTVTLVSSNLTMGTVSESGSIVENGYFTAIATPNEGYEFVEWRNGSTVVSTNATYVFQVTSDITLTAVFQQKVGIEDVDMENVTIYSANSTIYVKGVEGQDVHVYDVNGRMMYRELNAAESVEFRMTATGVYLVKVGNAPAKRVVVVR